MDVWANICESLADLSAGRYGGPLGWKNIAAHWAELPGNSWRTSEQIRETVVALWAEKLGILAEFLAKSREDLTGVWAQIWKNLANFGSKSGKLWRTFGIES